MSGRVLLVGGVLYAAVASLTRPLTRPAEIACVLAAAVVLFQACVRRPPGPAGPSRSLRRTALSWLAVLALAGAWELAAWLQQPAYNVPSHDHPTMSLLLDPLTERWPLRFAAWCGWLYAGWRLARR